MASSIFQRLPVLPLIINTHILSSYTVSILSPVGVWCHDSAMNHLLVSVSCLKDKPISTQTSQPRPHVMIPWMGFMAVRRAAPLHSSLKWIITDAWRIFLSPSRFQSRPTESCSFQSAPACFYFFRLSNRVLVVCLLVLVITVSADSGLDSDNVLGNFQITHNLFLLTDEKWPRKVLFTCDRGSCLHIKDIFTPVDIYNCLEQPAIT